LILLWGGCPIDNRRLVCVHRLGDGWHGCITLPHCPWPGTVLRSRREQRSSAQHLGSERYQYFCLAERRLKIVAADVEQAVVGLILEVQQSRKSIGSLLAAGFDLLEKLGSLMMILAS